MLIRSKREAVAAHSFCALAQTKDAPRGGDIVFLASELKIAPAKEWRICRLLSVVLRDCGEASSLVDALQVVESSVTFVQAGAQTAVHQL